MREGGAEPTRACRCAASLSRAKRPAEAAGRRDRVCVRPRRAHWCDQQQLHLLRWKRQPEPGGVRGGAIRVGGPNHRQALQIFGHLHKHRRFVVGVRSFSRHEAACPPPLPAAAAVARKHGAVVRLDAHEPAHACPRRLLRLLGVLLAREDLIVAYTVDLPGPPRAVACGEWRRSQAGVWVRRRVVSRSQSVAGCAGLRYKPWAFHGDQAQGGGTANSACRCTSRTCGYGGPRNATRV